MPELASVEWVRESLAQAPTFSSWKNLADLFSLAADYGLVAELYDACDALIESSGEIILADPNSLSEQKSKALIACIYRSHIDVLTRRNIPAQKELADRLCDIPDSFLKGHAHSILGLIDYLSRDFGGACQRFQNSVEAFLQANDSQGAIKALQRQATVSRENHEPEAVISLCDKGLEMCALAKERGLLYSLAFNNIKSGELVRCGKTKAAETLVSQTAKLAIKIPLSPIAAQAFYEFGQLQSEKHRYSAAIPWLLRARDWFSRFKQPITFATNLVLLRCYVHEQEHELAFQCAELLSRFPKNLAAARDWHEGIQEACALAIDLFQVGVADSWMHALAESEENDALTSLRKSLEIAKVRLSNSKHIDPIPGFPFLDAKGFESVLIDLQSGRFVAVDSKKALRVFKLKSNSLARELISTLVSHRSVSSAPFVFEENALIPVERQRLQRALRTLKDLGLIFETEVGAGFFLLPLSKTIVLNS